MSDKKPHELHSRMEEVW